MANADHLAMLLDEDEAWLEWRSFLEYQLEHQNEAEQPDLSGADLSGKDLSGKDLSNVNLSHAILRDADLKMATLREANLSNADLKGANLDSAILSEANLRGAILEETNLSEAILKKADLSTADLSKANLFRADLSETCLVSATLNGARLSGASLVRANGYKAGLGNADLYSANLSLIDLRDADLRNTNLYCADLRSADLIKANLSGANLVETQVLNTNFTGAILTGACIADWQNGESTRLDEVICDYIFQSTDEYGNFSGRVPVDPNSVFAPGDFTQLFQSLESAYKTIPLTFPNGIDWKAFFASFQELRSQHPNSDLSMQGMERKAKGFIVRLEVNGEADKATIETQAKRLYADQLQLVESQYRRQLHAKDREIEIYKQQSTDLLELAKLAASRPITVEAIAMANSNEGPKYNLQGAQFAGGFAETVQGDQIGGVINNYGASLDEITRLITALREQVQTFPPEQKDTALDLLDDIETDIKKPQPDTGRIGRKLKQLAAAGTAAATLASGVATFSGNLNDFASNVVDLTGKLGVPIELVQPSQGTP